MDAGGPDIEMAFSDIIDGAFGPSYKGEVPDAATLKKGLIILATEMAGYAVSAWDG